MIKFKWLHIWEYIKKHLEKWISYSILMMCVAMLILATYSNIAHRLPLLSFFATELNLPYLLELKGKVNIICSEEEQKLPVKINIGGYGVETKSGEVFEIKFSSTSTKDIPVIISFVYDNQEYVELEYVNFFKMDEMTCEYDYILGE